MGAAPRREPRHLFIGATAPPLVSWQLPQVVATRPSTQVIDMPAGATYCTEYSISY